MPTPVQRSPEEFEKAIISWLETKIPGVSELKITEQFRPQGVGNANETFVIQAAWRKGSAPGGAGYVVRIAPSGFQVMKDTRFKETARVQQLLSEFGAFPVPAVHWFEEDAGILGAPFCVMDRATGRSPTDNPSYNLPQTWVGQLTAAQRRTLWLNAMRNFTAIHKTPDLHERLPMPLRQPPTGVSGLEYELQYWEDFLSWAGKGQSHPVTLAARNWLEKNIPKVKPTGFAWGDARLENMMFDDELNCIAVLDWELACLAGPLFDLGWWLHMDRVGAFSSSPIGRASGLGTREETIAFWLEETGIPVDGLHWYEVFAAYRLVGFVSRYFTLAEESAFTMAGQTRLNNFAVMLMAEVMGIRDLSVYDALVPFPR